MPEGITTNNFHCKILAQVKLRVKSRITVAVGLSGTTGSVARHFLIVVMTEYLLLWGVGVLDWWSNGIIGFHQSINPSIHQSNNPLIQ